MLAISALVREHVDWAQRQVKLWNDQVAAAVHPVDAPLGVLDRVRIDNGAVRRY